jgi:LytS/YehU family sensor histidine kinase
MKIQRTIAVLLAVGALALGSAGPADAATKRKAPKAGVTCSIARLDSATARHTAQYNPKELGVEGITATDDWETVSMLCNNENVTGKVRAATQLKLVGAKGAANKTSGKVTGKVTLNYSFGATQTGSVILAPKNGTYSCADKTCTINANLVRPGKPNSIIAILIGLVHTERNSSGFVFEKIFIES